MKNMYHIPCTIPNKRICWITVRGISCPIISLFTCCWCGFFFHRNPLEPKIKLVPSAALSRKFLCVAFSSIDSSGCHCFKDGWSKGTRGGSGGINTGFCSQSVGSLEDARMARIWQLFSHLAGQLHNSYKVCLNWRSHVSQWKLHAECLGRWCLEIEQSLLEDSFPKSIKYQLCATQKYVTFTCSLRLNWY